ncbi:MULTISPECIES: hypothetical protein [unclassified Blastococcus]
MPARPLPLLACLLCLAACTTTTAGGASPATPGGGAGAGADAIALTDGDACGEVFFWAASDGGDVAVTVSVDVVGRAEDGPTRLRYGLPDPEVEVAVLTGQDLTANFCTDAIDAAAEPTGTQEATAGTVTLDLDPPGEDCGHSDGRLRIEGLVAADGTTFAPVDVSTGFVGCNVGG